MVQESRVKKSILNARINLICYFASLVVAFFTRKTLLDTLGTEFIGLTGTLNSLLGFLNLAELGVGTAIGYILYKPIFEQDHSKINEIISVFGYIYRCIGLFIIACGVILSCFLPWIFSDTNISIGAIYAGFYAYLVSSMLGYFINYKQNLLAADQRNYVITGYRQAVTTTKVIMQLVFALLWSSFYLYFTIELTFGIIYTIVLQWKINQTYPWLKSEVRQGSKLVSKYPEIGKYVKQIFVHKIAGFVQYQISPFLIYAFVSLPVVALYGNYTMIIDRVSGLFSSILGTTSAGVGNLISEGNREKIYRVYWELMSMRVLISGVMAVSCYFCIDSLIGVWLGNEYILSKMVVFTICCISFVNMMRGINDDFLYGFGLFSDVWAPIAEAIIFIVVSLLCGSKWGLIGVMMGSVVSMFCIICVWKPYFLYHKGFHLSVYKYWVRIIFYLLLLAVTTVVTMYLYDQVGTMIHITNPWVKLIVSAVCFAGMFALILTVLFYLFLPEFREFLKRLWFTKKILR
jgi:O-antigen/teichoic acid export membrane protein